MNHLKKILYGFIGIIFLVIFEPLIVQSPNNKHVATNQPTTKENEVIYCWWL